jgi:hypothetical protein
MQEDPTWHQLRPILESLDFSLRNTLSAVCGYAELVQENIATSKPVSLEVSMLTRVAKRCAASERLLHDLLRDPSGTIANFNRSVGV